MRAGGAAIREPVPRVDLLVNNAGVMATPEAQISVYETGAYPPALSEALAAVGSDPDVMGFGESAVGGVSWPLLPAIKDAVRNVISATTTEVLNGGDPATLWPAAVEQIKANLAADTTIPASGN